MGRTLIRRISVGTLVVAVAGIAALSAFAASGSRGRHLLPPRAGMMGPGFGMMGPHGFGVHGPGARGGLGLLGADVLTPAASYLGISLSDLQADLRSGKTLAQEATAKGKSVDGLVDAIVAAEKKVLDSKKAAGWLTDEQESMLLSKLEDGVADLVQNGPAVPPVVKAGTLQAAADYLGMSVSDLRSDLRAGKTLAGEAAAKGKSVDGLVQAMLAPLKAQLDKRVAAGDITAAQETSILNRETQRLTDLVNGKAGMRMRPAFGMGLRIALPFFR